MPSQHRRVAHVVVGFAAALIVFAACTTAENGDVAPPRTSPGSEQAPLPPPAEPEEAPPVQAPPAGTTVASLPAGSPEGAAVDPRSGTLAVALRSPDRLALVDTASDEVRIAPAPGAARHLVPGQPGNVLVLGENADSLARVALPSGRVQQRVETGRQPHDAAQVGDTVFVSNEGGSTVGVVRDGQQVRTIGDLAHPGGLTAAENRVAAVDVRGNDLHVFDTNTLEQVAELPAGSGPSHVRPIGAGRVAVADTRGNAVHVFDLTGEPRRTGSYGVSGRAYGLATDPARDRVYATLPNTNRVTAFDIRSDGSLSKSASLPTVRQPNDVAVDPSDGGVFVVGATESQIQRIPRTMFDPDGQRPTSSREPG